jgi:hypothetical protein
MRALVLTAMLVAVAVVGGCLGPEEVDDPKDPGQTAFRPEVTRERLPAPDVDLSGVIDDDHGGAPWLHAVPELHSGAYGLELVGYNPLTRPSEGTDLAGADSGYAALDVWEHLVCVTHFAGSTGAQGGATIVDISDPTKPTVLSMILSGAVNSRCMFSQDGQYVFLATYTGVHPGLPLAPPVGDLAANGVAVYDVSDPKAPRFLFHDSQGATEPGSGSYHNIWTLLIDGTHYIFQTGSGNVLRLKADGSGLEMVSRLEHSTHDFWGGQHPITGEWVIVTGAAYGTAVINVDDPENPVTLGIWEGDRANRTAGWHRQYPLENTVDGRAYIVVAGEECGNGHTLPYAVLDWTDPEDLFLTGTWWIPGKPKNPDHAHPHLCEMNSHEFEVWDGYVATGNYAGVWVFDVGSPERVMEPVTIGYYLPDQRPHEHGGTVNAPFAWSPDVWGAYFDDRGYIIAADWWSGLYVLKFGATQTG